MIEKLLATVTDADWQAQHEQALNDLPALREALAGFGARDQVELRVAEHGEELPLGRERSPQLADQAPHVDEHPDLLVVVADLAAEDGIPALVNIPFIFLTGTKKPGFQERAQELGAAGFLEKPFDPEALLNTMASALYPKPG